ncbi:hypothetical protein [Actinophytocola xinjiangensis]|nr:hypothetical protein [Actinophytocola xinjiangensis]
MVRSECSGRRTWRAWLGTGDGSSMTQLDVAEFASASSAKAWVEGRLASTTACPGSSVFGSIDLGRYRGSTWELDPAPGLDAELVDGRVAWRRPGR